MTDKARSILEKVGKLGGGLLGMGIGAGLGAGAGLLANDGRGDFDPLPVIGGALAGGAAGAIGGHLLTTSAVKTTGKAVQKATRSVSKKTRAVTTKASTTKHTATSTISKADAKLNKMVQARQNIGSRTMLSPNQATGKIERTPISGPAGKIEQVTVKGPNGAEKAEVLRPWDRKALIRKYDARGRVNMKVSANNRTIKQKYRAMEAAEASGNTRKVNRLLAQ